MAPPKKFNANKTGESPKSAAAILRKPAALPQKPGAIPKKPAGDPTKKMGDPKFIHPLIKPFPPAPPGPPQSKPGVPQLDYSLRDYTYDEKVDYMVRIRGLPKPTAIAAVKFYKKTPEFLSVSIFPGEQPPGVETADQCRQRMGR